MRLYILYDNAVTNATYRLGSSGTNVSIPVSNVDGISTIEIPDEVIIESNTNSYLYVGINNITVPVCYSPGIWLDEIDVTTYTTNNNYVAFVNPKASKAVKYKDLYRILQRYTNGTIARIHDVLGY